MNITNSTRSESLCRWAERAADLVRDRDVPAVAAIERAIAEFRDGRYLLTVLGKVKRGKSTLVNALLGRQDDLIAPIDRLPCSSVICRYVWSEQPSARVFYRSADRRQVAESIPYERIRDYVTEEGNPGNTKQVEALEVSGPFPHFDRDLILIDTPGAGSIHEYHDALLQAFIPQSDAVVFLVTAAMPIDEDELDLLRRIRAADIQKVVFAINKVDATTESELEEAVAHNRTFLAQAGIEVDRIHRISAKRALAGDTANSGVPEMLAEIRTLLETHKGKARESRLIKSVAEATLPTARALQLEVEVAGESTDELRRRLNELTQSRLRLREQGDLTSKVFLNRWNQAVDRFRDDISSCRDVVQHQVRDYVGASSAVALNRLQKELPGYVMQAVEDGLRQPVERLEKELADCCRELERDYPVVSFQLGGGAVTDSTGATLLVGTTAGAAAVAVGVGLISASQAAAAGAVAYVTTPTMIGVASSFFLGTAGPFITTTAVPTAVPAWVALAGSLGWTVGGIGVLAIPFAWSLAKSKQRQNLAQRAPELVEQAVKYLLDERIPALRRTAESIIEETKLRREHELAQVEATLARLSQEPLDPAKAAAARSVAEALQQLLEEQQGCRE